MSTEPSDVSGKLQIATDRGSLSTEIPQSQQFLGESKYNNEHQVIVGQEANTQNQALPAMVLKEYSFKKEDFNEDGKKRFEEEIKKESERSHYYVIEFDCASDDITTEAMNFIEKLIENNNKVIACCPKREWSFSSRVQEILKQKHLEVFKNIWKEVSLLPLVIWLFDKEMIEISQDFGGSTIAHYAARCNDEAAIEFLLSKDENILNIADKDGATILHLAARYGTEKLIKLLFSKKATFRAQSAKTICSPVVYAIQSGKLANLEVVMGYEEYPRDCPNEAVLMHAW